MPKREYVSFELGTKIIWTQKSEIAFGRNYYAKINVY